jgi:hypothetical protein
MVIYYQFSDPIGIHNLRSCQLPGAAKPSIRGNAITKTEPSSDNRAGANGLNGFAEHSRKCSSAEIFRPTGGDIDRLSGFWICSRHLPILRWLTIETRSRQHCSGWKQQTRCGV